MRYLRQLHISWHIAWMSAGVVIGAACSPLLSGVFADPIWLLPIVCCAVFVVVKRWIVLVTVSLLAGCLFGAWRGAHELALLKMYVPYYGRQLTIKGIVAEDATVGPHGDQRLRLNHVQLDGHLLHGVLWISTIRQYPVKRGDIVTVRGSLSEGFGTIPATMYRASISVIEHPQPGDIARRVRDWFTAGIKKAIPDPEASLGIGYLTGQKSALPQTFEEQLQAVGLTHAVVASGYNLTILVSLTRQLLQSISKYVATLAACVLMGGFILVTGFSPSMTRAGLVSGLSLAAWYYGRAIHPFVLLPFAAAVTILANPSYVWGDIGWCLSFAAFVGVVIVGPLLERYFWGEAKPGLLLQTIIETIAAEVVTLPIILVSFGHLAVYGLVANILVVPLIPCTMAGTFMAGVCGLVAPQWARVVGWPATTILHYMMSVIDRIAAIPGAVRDVHITWPFVVGSYVLLILICWRLWRKTKYQCKK